MEFLSSSCRETAKKREKKEKEKRQKKSVFPELVC
jgi:hypothetical protein